MKNRLFNKYAKCKQLETKKHIFTEYKSKRNEINELININKKKLYQNYFTESNKNLRKIWQGIKEIINLKAKNYDLPTCIIEKNETITDPFRISNQFNNYFSEIADNILKERKYEGEKNFSESLH